MLRIFFIEEAFSRASEPRTVRNRTSKSNVIRVNAVFSRSRPNYAGAHLISCEHADTRDSRNSFLRLFAASHAMYTCTGLAQPLETWRTPAPSRKNLSKFMSPPLGASGVNRPYL